VESIVHRFVEFPVPLKLLILNSLEAKFTALRMASAFRVILAALVQKLESATIRCAAISAFPAVAEAARKKQVTFMTKI